MLLSLTVQQKYGTYQQDKTKYVWTNIMSIGYNNKTIKTIEMGTKTVFNITHNNKSFYSLDYSFFDKGIRGKSNNEWGNTNNYLSVSVGDEYTTLTPLSATTFNRYYVPQAKIPTPPFIVEFNKHNVPTANIYFIIGNMSYQLSTAYNARLKNANHLKFVVENGEIIVTHDNVIEETKLTYTHLDYLRFQFNNTNQDVGNLQFSDFIVYPK